jgi:cytochrome c-type biogenesis protein CcmE
MDPSRKRAIRLTVALTAAVLLASALVFVSFASGAQEVTASQLLKDAQPGRTYVLAGSVVYGSVRHDGSALLFRIRDPKLHVSVPVRYTGIVPDPFAPGRAVMVNVQEQRANSAFVGQANSLTTKCPSKYKAQAGS